MGLWNRFRAIFGGLNWPARMQGSLADLDSRIDRLIRSPEGRGTLVVQIVGSAAFIQFTGGAQGVEMDFPLVTPQQRANEPRIRAFCDRHRLHVRVSFGSDGAGFIDVDLAPDAEAVSTIVRAAFAEIFDVRDPVRVEFLGDGLAVAPMSPRA